MESQWNMDGKTYRKLADAHAPHSGIVQNCLRAFCVGGGICLLAQALNDLYGKGLGLGREDAGLLASVTLIFCAILLTGIGVFDTIARFAGGGTLVPITGFANAVASPAIDCRSEGWILGVGAKIFTVAGPVLLYGTVAGVVWGVVYWVIHLF